MVRFRTPPSLPETEIARRLAIPDSQAWLAVFSDALAQTIYAHNYTQTSESALTPEQTAEYAYEVYEAWLNAAECGDETCPPPTVIGADEEPKRIHRKNPTTGRFEVLESDGSWSEPTGDDVIPEPEERAESTEDERLCYAATNAANVIKNLYAQVDEDINNEVDSDQIQINIATYVTTILAAALLNPTLASISAALGAFNLFVEIGQSIVLVNLWTDSFHEKYICLLKEHATDTSGVITFDFWAVNAAMLGPTFQGEYVYLIMQILYLHSVIGANGLNLAGATTAVTGDCATCGTWCYTFDFTLGTQGWQQGAYGIGSHSSGTGWVHGQGYAGSAYRRGVDIQNTFSSVVTRVELSFIYTAGTFDAAYSRWAILKDGATLANQTSALATGQHTMTWTGEVSVNAIRLHVWSSVRTTANYSGLATITSCLIEGKGENPFGTDNC